ncbi:ATP synthase subunit I [Desulfosoma caldarium]|uniref:ATP synthase I subunit n=1 Tax=Desulfosoma caldarium TaxID=610254 RepID=A0A3N1UR46_9BACT|nr:ATP synthase subunit I [Desulfosoma caldarium]ROQ91170.1 ATP synthase I subunit [Desulfosoma caldarium]
MGILLSDAKLIRRIQLVNVILLLSAVVAAALFFSLREALGVMVGGATVTVSFQVMKWQMGRAFGHPQRPPSKGVLFTKYYLRFLGTIFVVFTVLYYGWADPPAFLAGLSVVMVSIVLVAIVEAVKMVMRGEG